jgi:hypothetical protein
VFQAALQMPLNANFGVKMAEIQFLPNVEYVGANCKFADVPSGITNAA